MQNGQRKGAICANGSDRRGSTKHLLSIALSGMFTRTLNDLGTINEPLSITPQLIMSNSLEVGYGIWIGFLVDFQEV